MTSDPLDRFGAATAGWFRGSFERATEVQVRGWDRIARGDHTLMLAPTGSGKTLAAFLWSLDRLAREASTGSADDLPATRVVYVSPIKALAYDIERNLAAPLAGIQERGAGAELVVDVRTGDTPAKERERQRTHPGHILITTPESLYLMLASRAAARLTAVHTVIVDEIHALAPTKRGIHLALTLERLAHLVTAHGHADPQRIGLSATQRPLHEVARYLGGDREVAIVDASGPPALDLEIVVPSQDMDHPGTAGRDGGGMWPLIYPRLLELVLAHRTTIIFANSRRLAERIAQQLSELAVTTGRMPAAGELIRAHHGSVARHQRLEIEAAMKAGRLRAIVATSSLELGIDMGTVELVVQVESPGSVSRGLQRFGRAGHQVGGTSHGALIPKYRGDLLEAAVVARAMLDGQVEEIRVPDSALDVLAQQIVAMVAIDRWRVDDLERLIHRTASYRDLSRAALDGVLDMLAGRYPSDEFAELRPRLSWDRGTDTLIGRKGSRLLSVVSGGTIPDRGTYAVHAGPTGPRVGELDEEMVNETRKGETFVLGASTWRVEDITRDRVVVSPAPGEPGKMPFWRGEGPGRPIALGQRIGAFCRDLDARLATDDPAALEATRAWLAADYHLDPFAVDNLIDYISAQRAASGAVPSDRAITIERFRDELGDVRVCILTPFGSRIHAPWALAIAHSLEDELGYPIHPLWTDDGIAMRFADADALPPDDRLIPDPDRVERILVDELSHSSVFASQFRQNAARALLLPRRRPGQRTPLWVQRLRAQQLMGVALRYPAFPITLETYREVLRDIFDLPALRDVLQQIHTGAIRVDAASTGVASPFARSLVFDYVAAFLYEGDAPLAERKAQAITLDRDLLRELIGGDELRDLLDPEVVDRVELELQQLADDRKARTPDELHDLLRRVGDLSHADIVVRSTIPDHHGHELEATEASARPRTPLDLALRDLETARRIARVEIAAEPRWIATEDVARYRDALGVPAPPGIPDALLEPVPAPLESLLLRYARTHGPFVATTPAARWGLPAAVIEPVLALLEGRDQLVRGALRPGGRALDTCDPEVLRQLRRRTLVALRAQVAPVGAAVYARFLTRWHGLDHPRRGLGALRDTITHLEGVAMAFSELEHRILPARIADYHPQMLDELGAAGEVVWIGAGPIGARDGKVLLARRDRAIAIAPVPGAIADRTPVHDAILEHLATAGASFLIAIENACAPHHHEHDLRATVIAALWDLVWAGMVTNDTFAPLRSLGAPQRKAARAPRSRLGGAAFGGRWSLVASLGPPVSSTVRQHALATGLLARWGIASRAAARVDDLPGGMAGIGDVLRAMEDAGTVRRGLFVAGFDGAQYASSAAVDRLREGPSAATDRAARVIVMSAVDPACAWGGALPWPDLRDPELRPTRRIGASVILVDGELLAWVEPKGKRIGTAGPDELVELALTIGLPRIARTQRRRELVIETIDNTPADDSPWATALRAVGARVDYRGLAIAAG